MRGTKSCPDPVKLAKAVSEGPDESITSHLESCESCKRDWDEMTELVKLGRELPEGTPSDAQLENVRIGIYAGTMAESKSRLRLDVLAAITVAIAVIFAGAYLLSAKYIYNTSGDHQIASHTIYRSTVIPQGMADYVVESPQPNEVVRLKHGVIKVVVNPLMAGESFKVIVGDSEVVVRGTVFDVTADKGRLVQVQVASGMVEVHNKVKATEVKLAAGDNLTEQVASALPEDDQKTEPEAVLVAAKDSGIVSDSAPAIASSKKSSIEKPASTKSATEKPTASLKEDSITATEKIKDEKPALSPAVKDKKTAKTGKRRYMHPSFEQGWNALKAGKHSEAADAFTRVIATAGKSAVAEDAFYWRAVSLTRAGKSGQARSALISFIVEYPNSPRVGEAKVMLGWNYYRSGNLEKAKAWFTKALADKASHVRQGAKKGLAAVEGSMMPSDK